MIMSVFIINLKVLSGLDPDDIYVPEVPSDGFCHE